ncbi:MAG: hypothetical protein IMW90_02655 [Thermogemmatispora sp.]|jgi:putative transposase|uniref:hypothetical protein n=1 Tax=Thermogemmatispora sp. TaxID=1968838 RepID=UPI0019F231E7|nr:hypothetical protein [Thermogemmatispora sp.]MBE3564609.1 hypothetical protein [Thermogemmatispora sp.]
MLIYECKSRGNQAQYDAIEEARRVTQFIRNKCLRLWMNPRGTSRNGRQCFCSQLANGYVFALRLDS